MKSRYSRTGLLLCNVIYEGVWTAMLVEYEGRYAYESAILDDYLRSAYLSELAHLGHEIPDEV